jgi:hypothetical protein
MLKTIDIISLPRTTNAALCKISLCALSQPSTDLANRKWLVVVGTVHHELESTVSTRILSPESQPSLRPYTHWTAQMIGIKRCRYVARVRASNDDRDLIIPPMPVQTSARCQLFAYFRVSGGNERIGSRNIEINFLWIGVSAVFPGKGLWTSVVM